MRGSAQGECHPHTASKAARSSGSRVHHVAAGFFEGLQIRRLVLLALGAEQVDVVLGDVRALALATRDLERKRRQVLALDVRVQVGGREGQATVYELHGGEFGAEL